MEYDTLQYSIAQLVARCYHLKLDLPQLSLPQCCKNEAFLMISLKNLNWLYHYDENCRRKQNNSYIFT